jgi:hypothetical protein
VSFRAPLQHVQHEYCKSRLQVHKRKYFFGAVSKQWANIEGAPSSLSGHGAVGSNVGLVCLFLSDKIGPISGAKCLW